MSVVNVTCGTCLTPLDEDDLRAAVYDYPNTVVIPGECRHCFELRVVRLARKRRKWRFFTRR